MTPLSPMPLTMSCPLSPMPHLGYILCHIFAISYARPRTHTAYGPTSFYDECEVPSFQFPTRCPVVTHTMPYASHSRVPRTHVGYVLRNPYAMSGTNVRAGHTRLP
eukprot:1962385-Rhodomonas_salina.1